LVAGVCARKMNLTGNSLQSRVNNKMVLEATEMRESFDAEKRTGAIKERSLPSGVSWMC